MNRSLRSGLYAYCLRLGYKSKGLRIEKAISIYANNEKLVVFGDLVTWFEAINPVFAPKVVKKKIGHPIITKAESLSYPLFLKGKYWKWVRKKVLRRDGYKCTRCPSKKALQVHHLTYKHHLNEHLYLGDLVTLCKVCHKKEHS